MKVKFNNRQDGDFLTPWGRRHGITRA